MNTDEARKAFLEATHHLATAGDILTKIASLLVNPEDNTTAGPIEPDPTYPEAVQDAIREFLSRGEVDSRQLHEILYGVYVAGSILGAERQQADVNVNGAGSILGAINQAQNWNVNGAGSILGAERQQADVNYASPTPVPHYSSTKTTDYTFDDQGRITRMVEVSEGY